MIWAYHAGPGGCTVKAWHDRPGALSWRPEMTTLQTTIQRPRPAVEPSGAA
jgi:hypothetical protein